MEFEKPVVIIDNGSRSIKAGFSCDNHPVSMLPTAVGRPKDIVGRYGRIGAHYEVYTGDEAMKKRHELNINNPVVNGRIVHWDNMERVWHHVFYRELKVAPEDRAVIMTCAANTPMSEKVKCCEVFFEALNVPALCIQPQAVLANYAVGVTTGLSVDIGFDTTDICPVFEGGLLNYAHVQTGYAGRQMHEFLTEHLHGKCSSFETDGEHIIHDLLHNSMHVKKVITMPRRDHEMYVKTKCGEIVEVSQESFLAVEMFFQPEVVCNVVGKNWNVRALSDSIVSSANRVDSEIRPDMYRYMVLHGGLSVIPGLSERLSAELETKLKKPVNIITNEESYVGAWTGAATFAGISDSQRSFVTKKQYEDYGARIVKNKFL